MSVKNFAFSFVILLFTGFNLTAQNQWDVLNPKPSGNTGVKICFTSVNTGFVINNKQILMTVDCGEKWTVNKYITSSNDINFLSSLGFIVGNNGYVLKTSDEGKTWSQLNIGMTDNLNSVFVISNDTIIICATNRLIKSFDGGNTWQNKDIPNYEVIKSFFINSKTGHVACAFGKIMKTTDGGQTWRVTESVNYTPSGFLAISFINRNIGFASREHNDILKTSDGGEHWFKISGSSQPIYSINFFNEQNGFIAGEYGVILKTANGGSTWQGAGFQTGLIDGTTVYSLCFINSNIGFATGMRGMILKTTDGGQSWNKYAPTYGFISQLKFVSDITGFALAGNEFFKTTDAGNTWINMGAPMPNNNTGQFSFVNENVGYCIAGGDASLYLPSGNIFKTTNGGISWIKTNYGTGQHSDNLLSIDFVNENVGYATGAGGYNSVYKTIDGGNTWEVISTLSFEKIQFLNSETGFGKSYSQIYRTIDGGKNWILSYSHNNEITSFHFSDENNGYWTGDVSMLYNTHDGGVTWNKVNIPYGFYNCVKFYSANVGYILDDYGKLFKTTNGGASWDPLYNANGLNSIGFFGQNIYLSGANGQILKSTIDFQPVFLLLNPATVVSNSIVSLSGNVASNEGRIDNIRFEYGISSFSNAIPAFPEFVNTGTSVNIAVEIKELVSNTTYSYRLKASYNGQDYVSNVLQFKTFPDYELKMDYISNPTANDATAIGKVVSNNGAVTDIEIQYGTDTTFASRISSTPVSVAEGTSVFVRSYLYPLKPDTKYYVRLKATHNDKIIFSSIYTFNTLKEYIISFNTPSISGTNVTIQASVIANKDIFSNIVVEYGTTRNYGRSVNTTPNQVSKFILTYISAQLHNLSTDSLYYYRIKASMGSVLIHSEENILSLKGGVLMIPLKEEQVSVSSVILKGLINPNGKFIGNIRFQYGQTGSFTDSVNSNVYMVCNFTTTSLYATITGLEPGKNYHFRISASEGTKRYYSDEIVFTSGILTGVEYTGLFKDVLVYPNPASGYIYIRSPYIIERSELIDLNGRVLMIKKEEKFIDISAYPNGVYTLRLFINDKMISRRIIKQ